jgi:amino acid transporter
VELRGLEQLSSVTGEMKEPQRDFVRVLTWNTPMLIVTTIVPVAFALAVLGNWREWETGYIVTASRLIGGQALGAVMLIASLIGVLSLSNGTILYTTRIPATMAEDGYLPTWMGKLSRFGTPSRTIAVSLIVYCILANYRVEDLVNIYIWTRIATSLLTVFAVWQMRTKAADTPRGFRIPGGITGISYIVIFPLLLCAAKVYYSEPFVFRWAPLLLASGPVSYLILRWGLGMKPVSQPSTSGERDRY